MSRMNAMTLKSHKHFWLAYPSLIVLPKYSFKEYYTLKIFCFSVNFNKNSESHEGTFKFFSLSLSLSWRHLTLENFFRKKSKLNGEKIFTPFGFSCDKLKLNENWIERKKKEFLFVFLLFKLIKIVSKKSSELRRNKKREKKLFFFLKTKYDLCAAF